MRNTEKVKLDYKPVEKHHPRFSHYSKSVMTLCGVAVGFALFLYAVLAFSGSDASFKSSKPEPLLDEAIHLPEIISQKPIETMDSAIEETSWSTYKVRPGDNLAKLFHKLGISAQELHRLLSMDKHAQHLQHLFPGQQIKVKRDADGKLLALNQKIDDLRTLKVTREDDQFKAVLERSEVEKRITYGKAIIKDSLFMAGKNAQLEDKLIMELANIFAYDIDFALDIHANDGFKILYEEKYLDGEKVGVGSILAAEFTNQGKTHQAIRYEKEDGSSAYYAPDGSSLKKAFIRTPVKYTRISSHFNLKRMHPILHKIRAHRGVDYAAPRGTPVKASAHGKVIFMGKKGGYGNAIILQHGTKYSTLYAHLSRFNKRFKKGSRVSQGDIIGFVGSSGLATAPHLHYEFRINGVHHNPLTVALPNGKPIQTKYKSDFLKQKDTLFALMDYQDRVMVAQESAI